MAAIGSQTGGSITRPASFCGLAGLKPTFGKVDLTGVVPVSRRLDHLGPIARSVGDLAMMFAAMAPSEGSMAAFQPSATAPRLHLVQDDFFHQADTDVLEVTRSACERLQQAGDELWRLALPKSFEQVPAKHWCIMAVEAAETHFDRFAQHTDGYGPKIKSLVEEGLSTLAIDYAAALRHHEQFRGEIDETMITEAGIVALTPATVTAAPAGLESTGDPKFNSPWSYAGLPTVTIPCGLATNGMPCGLQLIGPRNGEALLLSVANWCESTLAFQGTPPLISQDEPG